MKVLLKVLTVFYLWLKIDLQNKYNGDIQSQNFCYIYNIFYNNISIIWRPIKQNFGVSIK